MSLIDSFRKEWVPLHAHMRALQIEREKFAEERDRRYTEVKNAEEKALKIKEEADKVALDLARQIQTYKDEKANELRTQIERERGNYASRSDLASLAEKLDSGMKSMDEKYDAITKPLLDFVARSRGGTAVWGDLAIKLGLIATAITLIFKFVN